MRHHVNQGGNAVRGESVPKIGRRPREGATTKGSASTTFVPLYYQLATELERKIDAGEYPVGAQLPTESKLAAMYGVSAITARGAMKVLLDKGRVERFAGRGTFVLPREPIRAAWGLGSIAEIDMTTSQSEMTTLSSGVVEAPDWVWRGFGLDRPERLHAMRNVRSVQNERFMMSDVYHHPAMTPIVRSRNFRRLLRERKLVVMALCESAGVALGEIRQSLWATRAPDDIADALLVAPGDPLLVVDRVFLATDGQAIQMGRTHYRVDHYRYNLNLRPIDEGSHATKTTGRRLLRPAAQAPAGIG